MHLGTVGDEDAVANTRSRDFVGKYRGPSMHKNFVDAIVVKVGPTMHVQTGSQLGTDEQGMQGEIGGPSTKKLRLPINYFELVFTFLLTLATFVVVVGRSFEEDCFFVV